MTLRLETSADGLNWTPVPDPQAPLQDYQRELASGKGDPIHDSFPLEGLDTRNGYRVRVARLGGEAPLDCAAAGYSIQYQDSPNETLVTLAPAVPTPEEPASDEPAAPEEGVLYGPEAVYHVEVDFQSRPEAGYGALKVALFMDDGQGELMVSSLEITPDADGQGHGQFPLEGLDQSALYRATAVEYAGETLAFDYSDHWDAVVAQAGGLAFSEAAADLSLSIVAQPHALAAMPSMSLMSFGAMKASPATHYTLTLALALNGAAAVDFPLGLSLSKDPVSGEVTCDLDAYPSEIASVSDPVVDEGGSVTLRVTVLTPDGDPALSYTVTIDSEAETYAISQSAAGYDASMSDATGAFSSGAASAALTAMALRDYTFSVYWNDNRADTRPDLTLTLQEDGSAVPSPPSPVVEPVSYNLTKYTYVGLPKYAGGASIGYSVLQEDVEGYVSTPRVDGVLNTVETTLTVSKQWYDASTREKTRPSSGDWLDYLSLMWQLRGSVSPTPLGPFDPSDPWDYTLDDTGDLWTLTVKGLPAYDETGHLLDYSVRETNVPSGDPSLGEYEQSVKNVGVYAEKTDPGTAYEGGTLINTIADTAGFAFTKVWKDDGDTVGRPQVKFYLYRYPMNSGLGFHTLSPVKGHDNMTLTGDAAEGEVVYAGDDALPRYDPLGNEYVYYIREIMTNPGDYKTEIANVTGPATTDFILPGATVTNIRKATTSVPFTKVWHAKAVQSMNGGIAVRLEQKLASAEDSAWAELETKTVTGFRTEAMTLSSAFSGLPKYDENGHAYQYRVREIGATLDAAAGIPTDNILEDQFSWGGYDFAVTQPAPGDGANTLENRLVGTTQLRVKKTWSPALEEGEPSSIQIEILQDGLAGWDAASVLLPAGVTWDSGARFTLSGTGNLDALFTNLPGYDAQGRAYVYTVAETAVTEPTGYGLWSISYSRDESGVKTATIVNGKGGGPTGLWFHVRKVWLDDGDLLRRIPVTVGLFYRDGTDPVETAVLTAADSWLGEIYHMPAGAETGNPDDYFIREIPGGGLTFEDYAAYRPLGQGYARTAYSRYQVTTQKINSSTYAISNQRMGKLTLTVNKQWAVGALGGKPLVALFELHKEGGGLVDSKTVPLSGGSCVFDNLEKFDENGAFIRYTVREAGLYGLVDEATFTPFVDGRIQLSAAPPEYLSSSGSAGPYRYGDTLDDPDRREYTFTNSLAGSGEISINKVWRDPGTGTPRRPDIRLSLYRYTGDASGAAELVATMRFWNTAIASNEWLWTCGFGSYPMFDEKGDRYHYFVKETILQASEYAVSYYSQKDGTPIQPDAEGKTTRETLAKQPGEVGPEGFAYASFNKDTTGTIINTLKGTRSLQSKKLWMNLPAWFHPADLPKVRFQLYRTTEDISKAITGEEAVQKDGADWVEALEFGKTTVTFAGLPTYDDYGSRYSYYVKELDGESTMPFHLDSYITINDKVRGTVTNTYDLGSPSVSIQVTKTWDWSKKIDHQVGFPGATFELHQTWDNGVRTRDAVIHTATVPGSPTADLSDITQTYLFTADASGAPLLRYAPDGREYGYYVVEKPIAGYSPTPGDGKSAVTWDPEHELGQAAFANAYEPQNYETLTATKVWADQDNAFGTRPAFNPAAMPLGFTLKRRTASVVDTAFSVSTSSWSQGTGPDAHKWFAVFTGPFPKYATTGQTFTYYVEETLAKPYDTHYRLTSGGGTLQLTNTLWTVNVLAKKSWQDTDGLVLDSVELSHLEDLGALPSEVTFEVWASEDGGLSWGTTGRTKTIPWATLLDAHLNDRYLTITQALPMFVPHSSQARRYWTEETRMVLRGVTLTPSAAGFTVDNPKPWDSNTISEITNRLALRKLYFVKNWVDENNRDGVRPDSIACTVTRSGVGSPTSTTVTLWASTDSSDPSGDAAHIAASNRWRGELLVPATGDYWTQEAAPGAGYVEDASARASAKDEDGRDNWWSFTNQRGKKLISVSAAKAWAGDSPWVSITRPASVTVRLEYRAGTGDWVDLSALTTPPDPEIPVGANAVKTLVPEVGGSWAASSVAWTGLPAYRAKASSWDSTVPLQYRVVETVPKGYTAAYNPVDISGDSASGSTANKITVTNSLVTVSIAGSKTWNDQSNKYGTRPTDLTLTVLADGAVMSPQPAVNWTTKTGNTWSYSVTGLPRYRKGTDAPVVYTVRETPVPDYTPSTTDPVAGSVNGTTGNVTAANFANTLVTVSLSGSKTWVDQSNKYGTRPASITLTVLADGVALPSQPSITWTKTDDTWTYSITGLPRYKKGTATNVAYSVREAAVAGYTPATPTTVTGTVVEATRNVSEADFTNTLVTVSISGSKTWVDQSDRYRTRPDAITLTVLADNVEMAPQPDIAWTKTGDAWTYSITGLPRYKKGTSTNVAYSVRETAVAGYTPTTNTTVTGTVNGTTRDVTGADFTNTLAAITIAGAKIWDDQNNKYARRPEDVILTVLADGVALSPQPGITWEKTGDAWTYSTAQVPRYQKGTSIPILYTVRETKALHYHLPADASGTVNPATGNVTGANLTNKLETVIISGSKTWTDESNKYSTRPSDLTLTVLADGKEMSPQPGIAWTKTFNPWAYSITGLPRYRPDGITQIVYTVQETPVADYTPSTTAPVTGTVAPATGNVTAANFANALVTVSLTGSKTWVDLSNKYRTRPDGIALTVLAEGTAMSPQPLISWTTTGDTWTYSITGLPRYKKGTATNIVYSVVETPVAGYTPATPTTVTGTVNADTGHVTGADFTNTLATVTIAGTKAWNDQGDLYARRPADVILTVLAGGVKLAPQPEITWTATGDAWTYSTAPVPRYQKGTSTPILYTVRETKASHYALPADASGTVDTATGNIAGADFANTLESVSISGSKTWNDQADKYGLRPDAITLAVLADGTKMSPQPEITWTKTADPWTYSITGLPRYRLDGATQIVYTVQETPSPGYLPSSTTPVAGLVDSVTGNVTTADFANSLIAVSISGAKTWVDQSNRYGARPDEISLTVLADGVALSPQPDIAWIKSGDTWTYQITGLPRYQKGTATSIRYSVVETAVAGYAPATDTTVTGTVHGGTHNVIGADFTNTLSTVSISGAKTWADQSNKYGMRPASIALTVLADGVALSPQPGIAWTESGDTWTYLITGLPRYQKGATTNISYSVVETGVAGYAPATDTTVTGTVDATTRDVTGADFTNTLVTVFLSGSKTWEDQSDKYGTRPTDIALTVLADGVALSPQPGITWTKTGDTWTYLITGLPRHQKGTATNISYSVVETAVAGYTPATDTAVTGTVDATTRNITGADFANSLVTLSISGSKTWEDQSDKYGTRPTDITLTVLADGVALSPQPEITWTKSGDTWAYSIAGLPRYQKGTATGIRYSVVETAVAAYPPETDTTVTGTADADTGHITGADFTNSLATVSIAGIKLWDDRDNRYGVRPEEITLTVLADGTEMSPQPAIHWTKAGDTWTYSISGLPRYVKGTASPVAYSLRETSVPYYHPQEDQSGLVDPATGDVTGADFHNKLISRLEIHNTTLNAATGATNAGGFVGLSATPPKRDTDPYQDDKILVGWGPETYWQNDATFTVRYLEYGAPEEGGWKSVTVSLNDISALKAISYFRDAELTMDGETVILRLAPHYTDMPYLTQVLAGFRPSLAVQNTTARHLGGHVGIQEKNPVFDGRYPDLAAYGEASPGYIVNMDHLQLMVPTGVSGSAGGDVHAFGIKPNADGRFTLTLPLEVAGLVQNVAVAGQVKVLNRDSTGNPARISVALDDLPAPLDIGIPFAPTPQESGVPQTGDPILWAVALLFLSGLLVVLMRRKKS